MILRNINQYIGWYTFDLFKIKCLQNLGWNIIKTNTACEQKKVSKFVTNPMPYVILGQIVPSESSHVLCYICYIEFPR